MGEVIDQDDYGESRRGCWRTIDWTAHERQQTITGRVVNYLDIGAGQTPVVLLHGHGATWRYWLTVIPALMARRRVIAVDLPGFGGSQAQPLATVSMGSVVDTLGELLDRLGIAGCDVMGHSLGSIIALEMAVAQPQRVRTLTLAGGPALSMIAMFTHPLRTARRQPQLALAVAADMMTAGLPIPVWLRRYVVRHDWLRRIAFAPYVTHPRGLAPDLAEQLMKGVGADGYFHIPRKARHYRLAPLEAITAPVLLVNGDQDVFVPPGDLDDFLTRVPHAESRIIADAGHLVTVEYPDRFVTCFEAFTCTPAGPGADAA